MRRTFALLALAAGVTTVLPAQGAWHPEIGIQAGYTKTKPAGTGADDAESFIMLPGGSTIAPLLTYGSLYAIIPWSNKIAVEPTFGFSQFEVGTNGATATRIGARIDYAITPKFYGAAGGVVNYIEQTGTHGTQLGLEVGLGYRLRITQGLNGRIEAQWVSTKNSDNVTGPFNAYSALIGVSTPLSAGGASRSSARSARATSSNSVWTRSVGFNAGYSRVHAVGGGDLVFLTAPGVGGSLAALGAYAPGPPILFAIFPIGRKIALEPGLDLTRIDQGGSSILSVSLGARLNYAFVHGWYGAIGGQLAHISPSGGNSASVFGGTLAFGARFNLTSSLGGRVELNYLTFPANTDLGAATNTTSVLFGLTMPLH
ncbi:MAG TPA: hypothetical protein VIV83_03985 [Gemmatimonadales bacterium]